MNSNSDLCALASRKSFTKFIYAQMEWKLRFNNYNGKVIYGITVDIKPKLAFTFHVRYACNAVSR